MAAKGSGGHGGAPMVEAVPGSDGQRTELAGLELEPASRSLTAGGSATWRFRVVDCDGKAVRSFEPEQGKLLHLIVVRTDFTGYQHLHPTLAADGTWSVEIKAPQAGRYRAIADFVIDERKYVLGTTLVAPGRGLGDRRCPPLPSMPRSTAMTSSCSARPCSRPARIPSSPSA